MDTIRNESLIKMALDTIDLVILRRQVDEAMSNKPVDLAGILPAYARPRPAGRLQPGRCCNEQGRLLDRPTSIDCPARLAAPRHNLGAESALKPDVTALLPDSH